MVKNSFIIFEEIRPIIPNEYYAKQFYISDDAIRIMDSTDLFRCYSPNYEEVQVASSVALEEFNRYLMNPNLHLFSFQKWAIAEPEVPSDLELMIYTAKWLAAIYRRLIGWSFIFKTVCMDDIFDHSIEFLYKLPQSALNSIDEFVKKLYTETTAIPNVDDGKENNISLKITLGGSNSEEISKVFERLTRVLTYFISPPRWRYH